jgi:vancomycin permeability regulator SanA
MAQDGAEHDSATTVRRRGPWVTQRRLRLAYQVLAVATVLFFLPVTFVRAEGDGAIRSVADVPAEPVGIVLGAQVLGDTPSSFLASRLDVALALWHAHKIKVFLVSGDNSAPDYNEPKAMRDYLVAKGVPRDLIVLDYAGFDTWQSCTRARRIFGVERAIVVSQTFHISRAAYLCRAAGIETYAVGDGNAAWALSPGQDLKSRGREVLAGFYAVYQATVTPNPEFLGRQETGIADALRVAG